MGGKIVKSSSQPWIARFYWNLVCVAYRSRNGENSLPIKCKMADGTQNVPN